MGSFGLNLLLLKLKTENWKYCSKIIFKCVNSIVRFIFNIFLVLVVPWNAWSEGKKKKKGKTQLWIQRKTLNPNEHYMSQEILQFFLRADFFEEHSIIKVVSCVWSGVIICLSLASMVESIMGLRGNSLPLWLLQLRIRYYMYALLTREPSITISSFRCTYIHFIIFLVGTEKSREGNFGVRIWKMSFNSTC